MAAVCELFVQSQRPRHLHLLPCLPTELAEGGYVSGLRARGGITISVAWQKGQLMAAVLSFKSFHPWLLGLQEGGNDPVQHHDGFFSMRSGHDANLNPQVADSPGPVHVHLRFPPTHSSRYHLEHLNPTAPRCATFQPEPDNIGAALLTILQFPCQVSLCVEALLGANCLGSTAPNDQPLDE